MRTKQALTTARTTAVPAALAPFVEQARAYFDGADAANTRRAYASAWQHFAAWCASQGVEAMPAAPETIALYVTAHAGRLKIATLQQRLSAISRRHRDAGLEPPIGHHLVRRVWRGIRRDKGVAVTKKAPTLTADIARMVAAAGDGIGGLRDRALILLGYAGALRRSELVALDRSDVETTRDGLIVAIRRSKTDQEGEGAKLGIPHGSAPTTCPVRALDAWIDAAAIVAGPLFRPIRRGGAVRVDRLSDRSVALIVKRLAGRAGLDPARYAGHSLRAGLVTQAALAGVAEHVIGRQSRHKSVAVLRGYVRVATLFEQNAAAKVGL